MNISEYLQFDLSFLSGMFVVASVLLSIRHARTQKGLFCASGVLLAFIAGVLFGIAVSVSRDLRLGPSARFSRGMFWFVVATTVVNLMDILLIKLWQKPLTIEEG